MEVFEYIVVLATGLFGILGTIANLKRERGGLTIIGWLFVVGIIACTIGSMILNWSNANETDRRHQELLGTLTGGDGYAEIILNVEENKAYPILSVIGDYSLRDVQITVMDASVYPDSTKMSHEDREAILHYKLLSHNAASELYKDVKLDLCCLDEYHYWFHVWSNNNNTIQEFKLQRIDDKWVQATRLVDHDDTRIIMKKTDADFQIQGDSIQW